MLMCSTDEQAGTEVSDLSPAEGATGFEARSIWLQIRLMFFKEVPDPVRLVRSDAPLSQGFGVRVSQGRHSSREAVAFLRESHSSRDWI